jgi:hypothetical protein
MAALGGVPEWPKGTGCKPVGSAYGGSNPPAPTSLPRPGGSIVSGAVKSRVGLRELVARGADVVKGEVHWSDEHRAYMKAGLKCQSCGHQDRIRGAVQYRLPDGTELSAGKNMGLLPKEAVAECRSCATRWPVFKGGTLALPPGDDSVETIETERSVEPHHSDPLELDNLGGTSPLRHTVTISQEWTQTVQVDSEHAKIENTTSGAEVPGLGTFGRKAEDAVKRSYSVSEQSRKVLTREFAFEVPPGTKRVVSFDYARVWQHGLARVTSSDGAVAELPFKVAVDMTVNLAVDDTTN